MANINGTSASETLQGTDDDDVINQYTKPQSGSDTVLALGGDDVIYAGTGTGDSNQVLRVDAGAGNDLIRYTIDNPAGFASVTLDGGDGDDTIAINLPRPVSATPAGLITVDGGAGHDILSLSDLSLLPRLALSNLEGLVYSGSNAPPTTLTFTTEQLNGINGSIVLPQPQSPASYTFFLSDGGTASLANTSMEGLSIHLASADTVFTGSQGSDSIFASDGSYTIHGGDGKDLIYAGGTSLSHGDQLLGDDGDDVIYLSNAAGFFVDGGSGQNTAHVTVSFSGLTIHAAGAATATGLSLPDGSNIRDIQTLDLTVIGDNTIYYAAANGSACSLSGKNTAAYSGAGSDSLGAQDVYITPGGQDTAGGNLVHIDYSTADAPVRMDSTSYYVRSQGYQFSDHVWIGGGTTGIAGSEASVTLLSNADVTGSAYNDVLVGHLYVDDHGYGNVGPALHTDIHAGAGDDIVTPGINDATLDGGTGTDTLTFDNPVYGVPANGGVTVDLSVTGPQASGYGVYTITGFENLTGSENDDQLRGDAGANVLFGAGGNDQLYGNGGDDVLIGGSGTNALHGGDGVNTAVYQGFSGRYAISVSGGSGTVTGAGLSDTLDQVQNVQFIDGTLSSDVNGAAAQVYRLYETALGRAPDQGGFDAYTAALNNGAAPTALAQGMADSAEFAQRFGGLSNDQFVDALYHAALHRDADPDGRAQYLAALDNGSLTRAGMVLSIAESQEQRGDTLPAVSAGLWSMDEAKAAIGLLYDAELGRAPDAGGLAAYAQEFAQGTSLKAIANQIAGSAEFAAIYHGHYYDGTFDQYVDTLYQTALHRAPDEGGRAAYVDELEHGYSLGDVAYQVALSAEHQHLLLSHPLTLVG